MEAVRAAKGGICLEWDVIKAVDATHRSITGITPVTLSLHKFEMVGLLKKKFPLIGEMDSVVIKGDISCKDHNNNCKRFYFCIKFAHFNMKVNGD